MSRLRESTVQDKALERLKEHYQAKYKIENIYSRKEVRTTKKFKQKRADGLLAFNSTVQLNHTVSLEAKSHRTLNSLITFNDDEKIGLYITLFAIICSVFIAYTFSDWPWYWLILSTISVLILTWFLMVGIVYLLELDHFKASSVVKQTQQYPANEKWIAISKSSYNLLGNQKSNLTYGKSHDHFREICKRNNIGILLISRTKTEILEKPNFTPGYYLDCYARQSEIVQKIRPS